jgi:RNA polymerase sigma factor (sigma-70 family)
MRKNLLVRRKVTEEEFKEALQDKDNKKVMNKILSQYSNVIPSEDLEACGMDAVWRCLGYHKKEKGNKFTTSLWRFVHWECCRQLKRIKRQNRLHTINFSTIETQDTFEIPVIRDKEIESVREAVNSLNHHHKEYIQQFYFERRTLKEIATMQGCSKETVRTRIKQAIKELTKLCVTGV